MPYSYIPYRGMRDRREIALWITAPIATFFAFRLFARLLYIRPPKPIYRAPDRSIKADAQQSSEPVPYPPDALPGARDVDTPYGSIRVNEWGPETGRKVLLVHGISTPSPVYASMAKMLVEKHGCRVMLFDLFGRGYSDTPDPLVYRQSTQLWTSQLLLVLSSSKLAWMGPDRFTLVGYSLGGGISANFASFFPHLVKSLVLIAPAGLVRPEHISWSSLLMYGAILPQSVVDRLVSKRLRGTDLARAETRNTNPPRDVKPIDPGQAVASEVPSHPALSKNSGAQIFPDRPGISIANTVSWQLDEHPGFLPAFISSIQHAPVTHQHDRWQIVGRQAGELDEGKVLLVLGRTDALIIAGEVADDATECLGKDHVTVKVIEGGHDLVVSNAIGCVDAMVGHWNKAG